MRKFTILLIIFLFLVYILNTITSMAQPATGQFSQGIYTIKDLKLMPNIPYNVQNLSPEETFIIIFDENKKIQETLRLAGNFTKYSIIPMTNNYGIIIYGHGNISFTQASAIP